MGKKSRRNRKTGNDAAGATSSASASATAANSASSGTNRCFHGSTADKFHPNSEFMKAVQGYLEMRDQVDLLNNQDGSRTQQEIAIEKRYIVDHKHLCTDPEFYRFIFSFCTKQYLASNNFKDQLRRQVIQYLLLLGLRCQYSATPDKLTKYLRDIETERGMIKMLVRETATYCDCMNEGKGIAKKMDKIALCHGCQKEFPKATLLICTGCQYVRYHSRECQINHRPIHKDKCNSLRSRSEAKV